MTLSRKAIMALTLEALQRRVAEHEAALEKTPRLLYDRLCVGWPGATRQILESWYRISSPVPKNVPEVLKHAYNLRELMKIESQRLSDEDVRVAEQLKEGGLKYCVYFLLRNGLVVYCGCTNKLLQRTAAHRHSSRGFDRILYFEVSTNRQEALLEERNWIRRLQPEYNSNGILNGKESSDHIDRPLKISQVAPLFGLTAARVRELVREGRIRAVRETSGGVWRISRDAVTEFLDRRGGGIRLPDPITKNPPRPLTNA